MSIDPQVIRSEQHRTIGTLIQRDAGILIDRWSRRASQEQSQAQRVHHDVLLDQLPSFLSALGHSLAEGAAPETSSHHGPAGEHGEQRWENGWSLPEVIRDYQILRLIILDYLHETMDRPLRSHEVMAVGLALDEAISVSVCMYVRNREEHIRQVERERAEKEKQAEETLARALQDADRRKNEFLAILGHELRNSLAPILQALEVLRRHGSAEPMIEQVRDLIERQARQMARLVDDLLDLSRMARGQVELRKERFDLATAVAQAIETSGPLIKVLTHQLSVTLPTEPLQLEADPTRLVQVIANLLNNAAKYTDPGGKIWLTGERENQEAVIRIRDTGSGIPPEMLPRIFDLFMQVDRSSERSNGGLGIGLTLVRKLVELHGGTVTAHSPGVGQGSEFVVRLPALPPAKKALVPEAAGATVAGSSRHILIIEDHPDGRETMTALLKVLGHQVQAAEDGPQGVAKALAAPPEVALIDLGLPRMDGYQVARQLRAALGEKIFLVALTGYGQAEDRRRTLEAGFDAHLVKPVDTEELTSLLTNLPGRSS